MKVQKILVPTDFSAISKAGLAVAVDFAKRQNASIDLVHVIGGYSEAGISFTPMSGAIPGGAAASEGGTFNPYLAQQKRDAEEKLKNLYDQYADGIEVNLRLYEGNPVNFLADYIEENKIDLVVMGSLGSRNLAQAAFSGSSAQKMIRKSNAPVLVIKDPSMTKFEPKDIIFASSFDEEEKEVIDTAKQLQSMFGSKLHLLYVLTRNDFHPTYQIRNHMKAFAQEHALTDFDEHIYNDHSIEEGIVHFAEEHSSDTILLGTHGRKGLSRFFFHSVAESLVDYSMANLLTFRI